MTDKQKTIRKEVSLKGTGLHTGKAVTITFKPAEENTGYLFRRVDIDHSPEIKAIVDNVVETSRSTVLQQNGASVATVEHVLSAVYGLSIDNLIIEIDGPETPILDGSSKKYTEKLTEAGIIQQNAGREYFVIKDNIEFSDPKTGTQIIAYPSEELSLNVMIDYNSTVLGKQYATLNSLSDYIDEIAPCKTFVFLKELEVLLNNNQIKGGDLSNALVIVEKEFTQKEFDRIADLFHKDHQIYHGRGILNEHDMTFSNEPARHKLLDLLGDMALIGMPLKGRIIATKPGHFSNIQFAKKIREEVKKKENLTLPELDPDTKPIYNNRSLKKFFPKNFSNILIDEIVQLTEYKITGLKRLTGNEAFFTENFNGNLLINRVLLIDAIVQTGRVLLLNKHITPYDHTHEIVKLDNIKFENNFIPGDTLLINIELTDPVDDESAELKAAAVVNGKFVCRGLVSIKTEPVK